VEAYAMTDVDDTFGYPNYTVIGSTPSNGDFCCWFDDQDGEVNEVDLFGSNHADVLELNFVDENLRYIDVAQSNPGLAGIVEGHGGDDYIEGSDDNQATNLLIYCLGGECDGLDGMADPDEIHGLGGDDYIEGGFGTDTLYGDDGNDYLIGQDQNDTLLGGNGDDYLEGDDGNDILDGRTGSDEMHGGNNADTLCGGAGTGDEFYGDGGADTYWTPSGSTSPTGTSDSSDHCGDAGSHASGWAGASCTYDVTTRPGGCSP